MLTASAVLYIDQKRPVAKEFDIYVLPLILLCAASININFSGSMLLKVSCKLWGRLLSITVLF